MIDSRYLLAAKLSLDIFLGILASYLAFWLRLGGDLSEFQDSINIYILAAIPLKAVLAYFFKTNRQFWRYCSTQDLLNMTKLCGIFILFQSTLIFMMHTFLRVPRSIPTLDGLLTLLMMGAARMAWRLYHERKGLSPLPHTVKKILIAGAGEAGAMIAKEMLKHQESGMVPIGFLDDDSTKYGINILGIPVMGKLSDLSRLVKIHDISEIVIAMPSAPGKVTRNVTELAGKAHVKSRTMPGLHELVSGKISISSLRNIEVEDLLKRDPVRLDMDDIAGYLTGKVVLITGAGGSIGSEVVRQTIRFAPEKIILLGRGENSLFNIENEIKRNYPEIRFSTVVCDVRNSEKLERVFNRYMPEVVFHAAAHKHVPMMEGNADEAILNNVGGTKNMIELSLRYGTRKFVNISTDKAVNPSSIMGASKRVAEMVVRQGAARAREGDSFISVRFGNVLGSRGSVIPLFREQIRRGGPVTVTHPDMTRYFMTIPEAAQLVLQAGGMNGNGTVYVLDMGDPIKITELAKDLIRLSGLEPGKDIEIAYTGIRPGEKLFEELLTAEEGTVATRHDKIFSAKSTVLPADLDAKLEELFAAAHAGDTRGIYDTFGEIIPKSNLKVPVNSNHKTVPSESEAS